MSDIQAMTLSEDDINGSDDDTNEIPAGTIVVYQTDEGRYGKFLVVTYGYDLHINWVTYDLSNDGTVYSEGEDLVIQGTCFAELDVGLNLLVLTHADFHWEQVTGTERYINPQNGATFAVYP